LRSNGNDRQRLGVEVGGHRASNRSFALTTAAPADPQTRLRAEFHRQVDVLVRLGYPQLVGVTSDAFVRRVAPLADTVAALPGGDTERIPLVLVIGEGLVSRVDAVALTEMSGRAGFTTMEDDDLKRFTPLEGVEIPAGPYLLSTSKPARPRSASCPTTL
jgi:hypothetical protein